MSVDSEAQMPALKSQLLLPLCVQTGQVAEALCLSCLIQLLEAQ